MNHNKWAETIRQFLEKTGHVLNETDYNTMDSFVYVLAEFLSGFDSVNQKKDTKKQTITANAEIKVSELKEFKTLLEKLVGNYTQLPLSVRNAIDAIMDCHQPEPVKTDVRFADPKEGMNLYLKKEAGAVYVCDRYGNKLNGMTHGELIQGADCITTMEIKFYPCGWVD